MERAVELHPRRVGTLLKLAEFQLILEQHEEALFTLERLRIVEPRNAEMFFMFGEVFRDMDRTDEAISAYQAAVDSDPELVDAYIRIGRLYEEKGSPIALRFYDNALRVDPLNQTALLAKGNYYGDQDDLPNALTTYKEMIRTAPQDADGYYNAGLIYLDMDSIQSARQHFDLAIKVAPSFAKAYYYRGLASQFMGNAAAARDDYEKALMFDSEDQRPQEALDQLEQTTPQ